MRSALYTSNAYWNHMSISSYHSTNLAGKMTCQPITCCSPRIGKTHRIGVPIEATASLQRWNSPRHIHDDPCRRRHTTIQSLQAVPTNMYDYLITIAGLRFLQMRSVGIELWHQEIEIVGQVDVSGCFSMHVVAAVALILDGGRVGWDVIQLPWIWTCGRC